MYRKTEAKMGVDFKEICKHIRLLWLFTRRYLISQMEYKGNFFTFLIIESIILLSKLLYLSVTYNTGVVINGLTPDAIMLYTGTFLIISAVYAAFFMFNFFNFRRLVRDGGFDLYITKPVSLQFMATLSTVNLTVSIPNLVVGIVLVVKAWKRLGISTNLVFLGGYLGLVVCGIILIYGLLLFPQLLSFKLINVNAINDIAAELSNFNIMPMYIYKKWMQNVGLFIFPIFVVTNFPTLYVLGRLSRPMIVWGVAVPLIVLIIVRYCWCRAIKHYTSATS